MMIYPCRAKQSIRRPSHPGEIIADLMTDMKESKADISRALDMDLKQLEALMQKQAPVTPAVAERLANVFGSELAMWMNLQSNYDLWKEK